MTNLSMSDTPITWLLLDDRASHRSQVMGVASQLGWPVIQKEIRYNGMAGLANVLLGPVCWHLTSESRRLIGPPWPELVISAGRRSAPVALAIKRRSPGTRLVHLMWPDISPERFDIIALPEHDTAQRTGANILRTLGSPHSISQHVLEAQAALWHQRIARLPRPRIALLIGGSTKNAVWEDADYKTLAAYASAEAERLSGSLMITSSPRTGTAGEALVQSLLTVPNLYHRFAAPVNIQGGDNPYTAFLGLADAVIVTGDSVSMCSEACATGRPVYVFIPPHLSKGKNAFLEAFFASGYAKGHTYPIRLDWQPAPFPDAALAVARAIQTQLFHQHAA